MTEKVNETDKPKRTCETCRFWVDMYKPGSEGHRATIHDSKHPSGDCRRYPPRPDDYSPDVWADYWCGEWQAAEDQSMSTDIPLEQFLASLPSVDSIRERLTELGCQEKALRKMLLIARQKERG